jgi:hypothetical protein
VSGSACPGEPEAEIVNCFVVDNETTVKGPPGTGSSLYVQGTTATVTHNTFARQTEASFAVYAGDNSVVTMTNNIISNFVVGIRKPSLGTGQVTAYYTLFWDNMFDYDPNPGVFIYYPVYDDPGFVNVTDYHLTAGSAAIDAGTDAGVIPDYDGDHRPAGQGFDIGADEVGYWVYLPLIARGD